MWYSFISTTDIIFLANYDSDPSQPPLFLNEVVQLCMSHHVCSYAIKNKKFISLTDLYNI